MKICVKTFKDGEPFVLRGVCVFRRFSAFFCRWQVVLAEVQSFMILHVNFCIVNS